MIVYKVFYKDYDRKIGIPLGRFDRKEKKPQRNDPVGNWYEMGYGILRKKGKR
jgi:hypothetical protein